MHAHIGVAKQAIYRAARHLASMRRAVDAEDPTTAKESITAVTHAHAQIHGALDSIEAWLRSDTPSDQRTMPGVRAVGL
jgi:hypothetical protein